MSALVITIDGELTTRNQAENAARTHRMAGATVKRDETERVKYAANGAEPVRTYPVVITCYWYRRNRRTDPDNVAGAVKYILDGLQAAGVLRNDGWGEVRELRHVFAVDSARPRVEVVIEESEP